jgi:curved DNA-binding protein CbpA
MAQRLEEALRVLGIPADSDPEHVAEAYRRLARATHPDVSADPDAAARFATLASAYRLVSATARSERSEHSADRPHARGMSSRTDPPTDVGSGLRTGFGRARPLGAVSPYLRAGRDRPPIVAGPVLVRRFRSEHASG